MFDFIGKRKIFFAIPIILITLGLIVNIIFGTELSISFKGGTLITYSYSGDIDMDKVEEIAKGVVDANVSITKGSDLEGSAETTKESMSIAFSKDLDFETRDKITKALVENFDNNIEQLSSNSVPATVGNSLFLKGFVAIAVAFILLLIYVAFRFRKIGGWSAGAFSLLAILHDITIAYLAFVVFRIPLDDNFIAVILTIIGWSLNDTIVIYDRIRENRLLYGESKDIAELVNMSLNQTVRRSINTSVATFLAIASVTVVGLVTNISSLLSFSLPMSIGVIAGSYSSIFIVAPLWVLWKEKEAERNKNKKNSPKGKSVKKKAKA